MNLKEFGYVVLAARDLEAWRHYTANVLGGQAHDLEGGAGLRLRFDERDCRMLVKASDEDKLTAVGWFVTDELALADARAELEGQGVALTAGSQAECIERRVNAFFWLTDPAGFRHEIAWGPVVNFRPRFISPTGTRFLMSQQGLGHIVLGCEMSQFEDTHRFWQDKLGIRVANVRHQATGGANQVRFPIRWYHIGNARQHSIALAPAIQPGQPRHGARHIQLEVPGIDDVGMCYDRCEKHEVALASTIGRHVNDMAISFYMATPSGFWIEYACGAPPMHWDSEIAYDEGGCGTVWGHKWLRSQ